MRVICAGVSAGLRPILPLSGPSALHIVCIVSHIYTATCNPVHRSFPRILRMTVGEKFQRARLLMSPRPEQHDIAKMLEPYNPNKGKPEKEITRSMVANWETNRTRTPDWAVSALAELSGISIRWFYEEADTNPVYISNDSKLLKTAETFRLPGTLSIARRAMRALPVLATITAGEPWMQNAEVEYEEVPDWGAEFERWGRIIEGDSMQPVFRSGDIAIFENRRHEINQVVHAYDDGRDTVKCIRGFGADVMLTPFNDEYESIPCKDWNVKGVCVGRIRRGQFNIKSQTDFPGGLSWAMRNAEF